MEDRLILETTFLIDLERESPEGAHSRFPGAVCRQRWTVRLGEVEPVFGQTGRVVLDITARTAHDGALKWTRAPSTPRAARSIFATFPSTCALPSGGRWSLRRVLQRPRRQRKRRVRRATAGHRGRVPATPVLQRAVRSAASTRRAPSCATCPGGCGAMETDVRTWHDGAGHDAVLPRETRPSGEAEAGTLPRLGGAGHLRPVHAEAGLRCKPRSRHAQLAGRSAGAAPLRRHRPGYQTLRTAYRYAARARAAHERGCACWARGWSSPSTGAASARAWPQDEEGAQPIPPTGRNRSSSSCTSSATTGDRLRRGPDLDGTLRGPEAVFALLLSYARQIGRRCVLFIADGAPWIWRASSASSPRSSPTQVLGLIVSCRKATLRRGQAAPLERDATHPLAQPAGAAQASTGGEVTALRELCRGRTAGKIRTHLNYFLKNRHRFAYTTMVGLGLPRGSGAVERHPSRHQSPHQGRIHLLATGERRRDSSPADPADGTADHDAGGCDA